MSAAGAEQHDLAGLPALLAREDGFTWVDIPQYDDAAHDVLHSTFGFHELTLRACRERNHVPSTHAYSDYLFLVLLAPETGVMGHVHLIELDQFIGRHFLVTVHGPINPAVPIERALVETQTRCAGSRKAGCGPRRRWTSPTPSSRRSPAVSTPRSGTWPRRSRGSSSA